MFPVEATQGAWARLRTSDGRHEIGGCGCGCPGASHGALCTPIMAAWIQDTACGQLLRRKSVRPGTRDLRQRQNLNECLLLRLLDGVGLLVLISDNNRLGSVHWLIQLVRAASCCRATKAMSTPFQIEAWTEYGLGVVILFLRFLSRWKTAGFRGWKGDDTFAVLTLLLWTAGCYSYVGRADN